MPSIPASWHATAAYLYVLNLDASGIAWEYLRRNPRYQRDWQGWSRSRRGSAARWRLVAFANPAFDARTVVPAWDNAVHAVVRLTYGAPVPSRRKPTFPLWRPTGQSLLTGCDDRLHVSLLHGAVTLCIEQGVDGCAPLAFAIPIGADAGKRWHLASRANTLLFGRSSRARFAGLERHRLADLRGLQALDGLAAGASHREIAGVIFGHDLVATAWGPDSDLRALTRYCLRRARSLANGGYVTLLAAGRRKRSSSDSP